MERSRSTNGQLPCGSTLGIFFSDGQGRSWGQTANFNQSENDDGFGLMSNNNNLITPSRAGGGSTNWPPQALMFAVIQIHKWLTRHKSARGGVEEKTLIDGCLKTKIDSNPSNYGRWPIKAGWLVGSHSHSIKSRK